MIQEADTVGTFQIESRAQMSMMPRLKPRCFYDLVVQIAIIRLGQIQGKVIHPYLERREGKASLTFPDLKLKPIFQEQLMWIALAAAVRRVKRLRHHPTQRTITQIAVELAAIPICRSQDIVAALFGE